MAGDGSQQRKPGFKTAVEDVKALATVLAMEAESILGRRTARVLGALALFAAVGGVLVWYIAPSGAAQKQALVVTLAQILGGTALLSGLYFTWRTLQVNREGQITERFTRAIDQLGKVEDGKKLFEIRVGGIYALERISRESEEDYWPIMEILTAYVREHAPWPPEKLSSEEEVEEGKPPKADIQAILTVIGRRERYPGHRESERLDLQSTNLRRSSALNEAHLAGAYFMGANLSNAILNGANLSGADLSEADLSRAKLSNANLMGANLMGANLMGANLTGANLWRSNLTAADLLGANLSEAKHLKQKLLEKARSGDENTKLPPISSPLRTGTGRPTNRSRETEPHSRTSENPYSTRFDE
jgi:hypothetical protein